MALRKHSSSQIDTTHSVGQIKSICQYQDVMHQTTIGDMVNQKEQIPSTIIRKKLIRRISVNKKWSAQQIKRLHKCVEIFGIDFTLIGKMFKNRTRCELMSKFKKQDKANRQKVDKALKANKQMRLSKYVKRQRNIRKQSLVSVNSLDSTDINLVNQVRNMINEI